VRREALVWDTKERMERGVGVAGNGVVLLNGQVTKRDSIVSDEERVSKNCGFWDVTPCGSCKNRRVGGT
jgi:hypothetical protein